MSIGKILIRADAGLALGTGHVMRCLALAQAWRAQGGEAVFVMAESTLQVESRLQQENFPAVRISENPGSLADSNFVAELAKAEGFNWVVLDGPQFPPDYQMSIKSAGPRLLAVDDGGERGHYAADLILNQNLNASESSYRDRESYTRLLLGTSYLLLREEFVKRTCRRRVPPYGRRVLVTLGGTDPGSVTRRIIQTGILHKYQATYVLGSPEHESLNDIEKEPICVVQNPPDMSQWMSNSDIALLCAGGTLWEALFMGCAVLSWTRNPVQEEIMSELHRRNAARCLGSINQFDSTRLANQISKLAMSADARRRMSAAGRRVLDGHGADRVVQCMRDSDDHCRRN